MIKSDRFWTLLIGSSDTYFHKFCNYVQAYDLFPRKLSKTLSKKKSKNFELSKISYNPNIGNSWKWIGFYTMMQWKNMNFKPVSFSLFIPRFSDLPPSLGFLRDRPWLARPSYIMLILLTALQPYLLLWRKCCTAQWFEWYRRVYLGKDFYKKSNQNNSKVTTVLVWIFMNNSIFSTSKEVIFPYIHLVSIFIWCFIHNHYSSWESEQFIFMRLETLCYPSIHHS